MISPTWRENFSGHIYGGYLKASGKFLHSREDQMLVYHVCLTFCDPMDWSPPDSSIHGILQARRLESVAIPSSRGPSQPRDWTQVSCTAGRFFTVWAARESTLKNVFWPINSTNLYWVNCQVKCLGLFKAENWFKSTPFTQEKTLQRHTL